MKALRESTPDGHGSVQCPMCGGALDDEVREWEWKSIKVVPFYRTEMECIYCEQMIAVYWQVVSKPKRLVEMETE